MCNYFSAKLLGLAEGNKTRINRCLDGFSAMAIIQCDWITNPIKYKSYTS
jgi:hypothetical protein